MDIFLQDHYTIMPINGEFYTGSRMCGPMRAVHILPMTPLSHTKQISDWAVLKNSKGNTMRICPESSEDSDSTLRLNLRSRPLIVNPSFHLDYHQKPLSSTTIPSLPSHLPVSKKRLAPSQNDTTLQPPSKLCRLEDRPRIPMTNPHYRRRSTDAMCSVPHIPVSEEAFTTKCTSSQQTTLGDYLTVKKTNPLLTTVETQTSPIYSADFVRPLEKFNSSKKVSENIVSEPKRSLRRSSGSRQLLSSLCTSAKKTIKTLRRAVSAERLGKLSVNHDTSLDPSGRSLTHRFQTSSSWHNSRRSSGTESAQLLSSRSLTMASAWSLLEMSSKPTRLRKTVELKRPKNANFGFFVVKKGRDLFVSRIAENANHLDGLIRQDDILVSINGLVCSDCSLEEIYQSISGAKKLTIEILTNFSS